MAQYSGTLEGRRTSGGWQRDGRGRQALILLLLMALSFSLLHSCSARQNRGGTFSQELENLYLRGELAKAYTAASARLESSSSRDRLLYLLQAGSILHSLYRWEQSNALFREALAISDTQTKEISENLRVFFLNDGKKEYIPENFERILIFYYLATNFIMLDQQEEAYRYFKRMSNELGLIRDFDAAYKENYAFRYLYAILATALDREEEARVQYNNIIQVGGDQNEEFAAIGEAGLYELGLRTANEEDLVRYATNADRLRVLLPIKTQVETQGESTPREILRTGVSVEGTSANTILTPQTYADMGSIVIIHESGLAPYKESQGKIGNDAAFEAALKAAVAVTIVTDSLAGLNYGQIILWILASENPIPKYTRRETNPIIDDFVFELSPQAPTLLSTQERPILQASYGQTVIENFNDRYPDYRKKHAASILTKAAITIAAAAVTEQAVGGDLGAILGFFVNLSGGATIKRTLKPDLRSWSLAFEDIAITRVFVPPGEYSLGFVPQGTATSNRSASRLRLNASEVVVEKGRPTFVYAQSF